MNYGYKQSIYIKSFYDTQTARRKDEILSEKILSSKKGTPKNTVAHDAREVMHDVYGVGKILTSCETFALVKFVECNRKIQVSHAELKNYNQC